MMMMMMSEDDHPVWNQTKLYFVSTLYNVAIATILRTAANIDSWSYEVYQVKANWQDGNADDDHDADDADAVGY